MMTKTQHAKATEAFTKVLEEAGTLSYLAKQLGVSASAVYQMKLRGFISEGCVERVAALYANLVNEHELRPDIFDERRTKD